MLALLATLAANSIQAGVVAIAATPVSISSPAAEPAKIAPYKKRGDQVEAHYREYTSRLATLHDELVRAAKENAPELISRLTPAAPKPTLYGYQILPRIVADDPKILAMRTTGPVSVSYSWDKTDAYIDWQMVRIADVREQLSSVPRVDVSGRKQILEKLITDFKTLEDDQGTIDEHVQYNRFWQNAIAADKPRFDRLTVLHDMVLDLQKTKDPEKEKTYKKAITEEADYVSPVKFLRVTAPKSADGSWQLKIPVYTDITDQKFVSELVKTIESFWTLSSGNERFRLKIELRPLTLKALYKGEKPPAAGSHIDVDQHIAHFPKDGAVLTTGSNMTYAVPGRFIVLGPQPLSRRVLAHEFGHILGFIDNYFRGYRDLGDRGFEVLEVVADPKNIMASPETGEVLRHHFEKLIKANAKPEIAAKLKPAP